MIALIIRRAAASVAAPFVVALVAALLGACTGSLLETKQVVSTTYVLAPPPGGSAAQPMATDLAVSLPRVAPGIEGERIAVLKGRELDYYAGSRWGADVSRLVQSFIVRTLAAQNTFRSVAAEDVRIASAYQLDVEVTDFQAEYEGLGAPQARVAFVAHVVRVHDRTLVDTLSATATASAGSNRMSEVVAAFEAAARQASVELAEKVAAAARKDIDASSKK